MKRKLKLYLLSVLFFAVLFGVIFCTAELTLRYVVLNSSEESRDHVRETPYMPVKLKENYQGVFWGVPFRTNKYGFRDEPDFSETPGPGEFRIMSLGDSIGFGLGIPAANHYTKVLQRRLNEDPSPLSFRVINASGQGYSPSNYYAYLTHGGLRIQPHMVIADIEMNTVVTNEALLHWRIDPEKPHVPSVIRGGRYVVGWDGNMLATYAVQGAFFEKTYVYTDLLRRLLNLAFQIDPNQPWKSQNETGVSYYNLGFDRYLLDPERIQDGWDKTFKSILGIQRLLESKGIAFRLLIMPSRYMYDDSAGQWQRFATDLMEKGIRRARENGIHFLEFSQAVSDGGGKELYFDFAHMNSQGNLVVGEALYKGLGSQLELQEGQVSARHPGP